FKKDEKNIDYIIYDIGHFALEEDGNEIIIKIRSIMGKKKHFVWLMIWLSTSSLIAQDVTGAWGGALDIQGTRLRVVFNVTQGPQGFSATLDSPDQGVKDMPIASTEINGSTITFGLPEARITYRGVFKDSLIVGTFTQNNRDFPLNLKRQFSTDALKFNR